MQVATASGVSCRNSQLNRCWVGWQDGWIQQTPIKFGGVKPTDAANPEYFGLRDCGDKVLNYEGVGSSISCGLNVRGLSKRPRRSTPRSLPLSVLRERDREVEGGTYKLLTCGCIHECNRQILTANHIREPITKGELTFDAAGLVKRLGYVWPFPLSIRLRRLLY